jgi:uncharacterized hydrophobic protein (TIGR00271 family)
VPETLTGRATDLLLASSAVSSLAVLPGASVRPAGSLLMAEVAREATDQLVDDLIAMGVHREGIIQLEPVRTWVSRPGLEAERRTPGFSSDAVVWPEVTQQAYEDSELSWTYASFIALATLIASVAIVTDSQVLMIGAMVLGPEFGAVAAVGLALVRRRHHLLRTALRTLVLGFVIAIGFALVAALVGRALGWVTLTDLVSRTSTDFIYSPNRWSLIVALIAGAAGVLSLTSEKAGAMAGVFISVTTIPAAGNVALGLAFGAWSEVAGSAEQLGVNLLGMMLAGWATLVVQQAVWSRIDARRALHADHPTAGG